MRIAVFHNLPFGGARRVMVEQVNRLGGAVCGVYALGGESDPEFGRALPVHRFPFARTRLLGKPFGRVNGAIRIVDLIRLTRRSRRVASAIDDEHCDVVFVHNCAISQTPPVLQFLKTPAVYYCQEPFRAMLEAPLGGGLMLPPGDPLRRIYARRAVASELRGLRSARAVLANSWFSRESMLRYYDVDSIVNYLGVDHCVFSPQPVKKRRLVLSVGRLAPEKGHAFVIESVGLIPSDERPNVGIVCGTPDARAKQDLERTAAANGVTVEFFANISDLELSELYSSAICTAAAPILEPFGLTPLESMACGTPVVGVAEGGIRESVIDGVTGFLTQRDRREFAGCIRRLLANPDVAGQMGAAGRDCVVAKWNWDRSIAQLEQVLSEAARS